MPESHHSAPTDPAKERALKKYEAAAEPIAQDDQTEFFSPFGPIISRSQLPTEVVEFLNHYADQVLEGESDRNREFVLDPRAFNPGHAGALQPIIIEEVLRYCRSVEGNEPDAIQVQSAWVVNQQSEAYSPTHFHSADISGVLYLRMPEVSQNEEQASYISGRKAGYINFLSGGKQPFCKSLISFKPRIGEIYLFPSWLLHTVEPFVGSGERRSLAFNVRLRYDDA